MRKKRLFEKAQNVYIFLEWRRQDPKDEQTR